LETESSPTEPTHRSVENNPQTHGAVNPDRGVQKEGEGISDWERKRHRRKSPPVHKG
jgi:hypothetical protein